MLFGLIVLGAGVRIADAGLACPDWPLCFGKAIPAFDTQIFLEWIHRVIAGVVGLLALCNAYLILSHPSLRSGNVLLVLGSLFLFLFQAFLGGQTVIQLLRAEIVTAHLVGGYLLWTVNLKLLLKLKDVSSWSVPRASLVRNLSFFCWAFIFFQATLGGLVSSHYAGMACPDFPTCHGSWWPGFSGAIGFQFAHRLGALSISHHLLSLAALSFFRNYAFQKWVWVILGLIVVQVLVGWSMIYSAVHPALSLSHSANSMTIFSIMTVILFRGFRERSS